MKNLNVKKYLFFSISTLLFSAGPAHAEISGLCEGPQKLFDFSAYTLGNMEVQNSDFEGSVGVQGILAASNFAFVVGENKCLSVSTTGRLAINSSSVDKDVESADHVIISSSGLQGSLIARSAELHSMAVHGRVILGRQARSEDIIMGSASVGDVSYESILPLRVDHKRIGEELMDMSVQLSLLQPTTSIKGEDGALLIKAEGEQTVVQISATELRKSSILQIFADRSQKVVINVSGENVAINGLFVRLLGGIQAEQIIWNISDANNLEISKTKNPSYGLPGRVLAPHASTYFHEALIVGGLYVRTMVVDLEKNFDGKTGQINRPGHYNDAGQPYN